MKTSEYLELMAPWEHEVDGLPTRRPTVGDMVAIEALDKGASFTRLRDFIRGLFPGECPDLEAMDLPVAMAILTDYGQTSGEYLRKNSARLAAARMSRPAAGK